MPIGIGDNVIVKWPRDLATKDQRVKVISLPTQQKPYWEFERLSDGEQITATIPIILGLATP